MPLTYEAIWDAWRTAGEAHRFRVTLLPSGGNVRTHLQAIKELVRDEAELTRALRAWWASPAVPMSKRYLGMFVAQLPQVLHHLESGALGAFGVELPTATGVRGSKTQDNAASVQAAIARFRGHHD